MGKTTDLRRGLRTTFLPHLEARGFTIDMADAPMFTRWRRPAGDSVQLLELQWDKYGRPRFVINFGTCPVGGLEIRGERFPIERVLVGWLSEYGRLQPKRGHSPSKWFSQERPFLARLLSPTKLRSAESVVRELLTLYPEVETYWASGAVGKHIMIVRIPRPGQTLVTP
jgi:hypothetical protein